MKKTLLFTTKNLLLSSLLVSGLSFNYGWSQTNLVVNGTGDVHTFDVNDNADAFDMTPPTTLDDNVASPYRFNAITNPNGWNNSDLDTWLGTNSNPSSTNEQPNTTSDGTYNGATKTRGYKFGNNSRRMYQKIAVTPNTVYTFSMDSRSEEANINSEVFMLNTEIADEVNFSSSSSTVDGYLNITNDFNSSSGSETNNTFTKNTFNFTASGSFVVIYIRALAITNTSQETFYDNLSLTAAATASVNDVLASKVVVYPNPAQDFINIKTNNVKLTGVELYNVLGAKVLSQKTLTNNQLNVSNLAKGVYMLKVNAEGASTTKKIVIQ